MKGTDSLTLLDSTPFSVDSSFTVMVTLNHSKKKGVGETQMARGDHSPLT